MRVIQRTGGLGRLVAVALAGWLSFFSSVRSDQLMADAPPPLTNDIRLNFHGASIEEVLNYLSEAAGFVIVNEAQPKGKLDVWAADPVSKDEAFDLLNQALLRNGYAALRKGRVLTIIARDQAKTRALPVKQGADPENVPQTAELVTQIVPVKYVEAAQLLPVLQPLSSTHSTMTANESANTIVITDTQENIRRLMQVIQGIDNGAEDFTIVRVFHLKNANSTEMADVITGLFPDDSRSQQQGSGSRVTGGFPGGPGGGFPGGFGPGGGSQDANTSASSSSGNQSRRLNNRAKVTAVADQRTQSLVVTASRDLMPQVEAVVSQLDMDPKGKQELALIDVKNASPQSLMKVLQDAFMKNGSSGNRNTTTDTDVLGNRATTQAQQNNQTAAGSSFGTGGAGRSGFGGGGGSSGGP